MVTFTGQWFMDEVRMFSPQGLSSDCLKISAREGRKMEKRGKSRVQRRLACSVGDSPIGVMVRSPVAWIAGRRDEQPTRLGI